MMGLFFEEGKRKKSSKSVTIIRFMLIIGMFTCLIISFMKDYDFTYMGFACLLVGVSNILNGIESHYHREKKKVFISEYLLGVLLFIMAISYLS